MALRKLFSGKWSLSAVEFISSSEVKVTRTAYRLVQNVLWTIVKKGRCVFDTDDRFRE